jgi:hemolysin activation/secretion protein
MKDQGLGRGGGQGRFGWLAALAMMPVGMAFGQPAAPDAGVELERRQQILENFRIQERIEREQERTPTDVEAPAREAVPEGADEKVIQVRRFEIGESEILEPEQIERVTEPYVGRTISLRDLFDVVRQLNALYDEAGYPTARAVLPAQDVVEGVVEIRLVEARVGEVKLDEPELLEDRFILERIGAEEGELLSIRRLESSLVRFNRLNDVRLRANLTPGADFGTTDVVLDLDEPDWFSLSLFTDNTGRETVGRERVGGILRLASVLGRSDPLQVTGDWAEGSNSYSISYSVPITPDDLRFEVSWQEGEIEVIEGPFEPLDVTGTSHDLTFGLSYPFYVDAVSQWSLYSRFSLTESANEFGGVTQTDVDSRVARLGLNVQSSDEAGVWYTDHSANVGIHGLGGEDTFFTYRGSVTRLHRLGGPVTLVGRAGWQYSPERNLPSSERFQIGGQYTVRGFSEGLLIARTGYYLSAELRIPIVATEKGLLSDQVGDRLDGFLFLEHGGTFPFKGADEGVDSDDFLTGAGFGFMWDLSERVNGRVSFGFPLNDNANEVDEREPFIHFFVQFNVF